MGEISAKHLRGDSMADVIFNGSSSRKPVGQALGRTGVRQLRRQARRRVRRLRRGVAEARRVARRPVVVFPERRALPPQGHHAAVPRHRPRLAQLRDHRAGHDLARHRGQARRAARLPRGGGRHLAATRSDAARPRTASRTPTRTSSACHDLRDEVEKQLRHLQRQARHRASLPGAEAGRAARCTPSCSRCACASSRANRGARQAILSERELALQAAIAEQRVGRGADREAPRQDHASTATVLSTRCRVATTRSAPRSPRAEQAIEHAREIRSRQRRNSNRSRRALQEADRAPRARRRASRDLAAALARSSSRASSRRAGRGGAASTALAAAEARHAGLAGALGAVQPSRCAGHREPRKSERARIEQFEQPAAALVAQRERARRRAHGAVGGRCRRPRWRGRAQRGGGTLGHRCAARAHEPAWSATLQGDAQPGTGAGRGVAQRRGARCRTPRAASCPSRRCSAQRSARARARSSTGSQSRGLGGNPRLARPAARWMPAGIVPSRRCSARTSRRCASIRSTTSPGVLESLTAGTVTFFAGAQGPARQRPDAGSLRARVRGRHGLDALFEGIVATDTLAEALAVRPRLRAGQSVITRDGLWIGRGLAAGESRPRRTRGRARARAVAAARTRRARVRCRGAAAPRTRRLEAVRGSRARNGGPAGRRTGAVVAQRRRAHEPARAARLAARQGGAARRSHAAARRSS